jgi:ATP-dependent RNA helicase RhlE
MPDAILGLAHEMMRDPVSVQVGFQTAAAGITEVLHPVDYASKQALVYHLLDSWGTGPALVFTRMKSTAAYLCEFLKKKGVSVDDLHGDKGQADRTRSLTRFREGKTRVLVATNVAARGLDIVGITHVVNFDVPDDPKDYVHRVGRTARGDQTGDAVTLMSPHEVMMVREIEKLMDTQIPRAVVEGFEPAFSPDIGRRAEIPADVTPRSRLARGRRRR